MNKHLFHYRLISLICVINTLALCHAGEAQLQPVQSTLMVTDTTSKQTELSDVTAHVEQAAQPIVAGGASIASDIVYTTTTQAAFADQANEATTTFIQSDTTVNNQAEDTTAQAPQMQDVQSAENTAVTQVTITPENVEQPITSSGTPVFAVQNVVPEITYNEQSTVAANIPEVAVENVPEIDQIARVQNEFDEGIDTIDDEDSGNWYLKRSLWKKAKPKYDEIRKVANRVERSIKSFLDKRKKIEETNETFFFEMGVDQGEIAAIVAQTIEAQKKMQAIDAQLADEQKKEIADAQAKKQEELDTLKNYIDVIKKTDDNLMDAIFNSLIEQQQLVQSYEEKALDNYYKISEILDDKKARELLNEMDNFVENVYAIEKWINGPLTQYVDQSAVRLTELMQKTHMVVSSLKQQGIELKKQMTQDELNAEEARKKNEAEKLAKAQAAARAAMAHKGFFATVWSVIYEFFASVVTLISAPFAYVYTLIVGK